MISDRLVKLYMAQLITCFVSSGYLTTFGLLDRYKSLFMAIKEDEEMVYSVHAIVEAMQVICSCNQEN